MHSIHGDTRPARPPSATRAPAVATPPTTMPVLVRPPTPTDGAAMWSLARGAVDDNSPYAYLMMCEYFTHTCAIAVIDDDPVGFVTGFAVPDDPTTLFVWQIVVSPSARGNGVGARLLDHFFVPRPERFVRLEATVTAANTASRRLFHGFAERHDAPCEEQVLFPADHFPAGTAHDPEVRFRIGPVR